MGNVPEVKKENLLMQQFTGTKTVEACKVSRKAAEVIIGRKIYNDDREDEPGYLVRYADGYTSWSPKKAFEDAYNPSETHIDRMKIELNEVKTRYLKGRDFTFSQAFRHLTEEQRALLRKQLDQMEGYIYTLSRRIELSIEIESAPCGSK